MNYSDVRQNLANVLETAHNGEAVKVLRHGQEVAVILNPKEYEAYQQSKLDKEFEEIMASHGEQIKALSDR